MGLPRRPPVRRPRCRSVFPVAIRPWRSRGVRGSSCRACDSRSSGSRGPLAAHSADPASTGPADRPSTAGSGLSADRCAAAPARHQLVAAVGTVGADQDRHLRKSLPQPVHERRDRLHHARRHIAARRAQFRPHRPAVAEHQPRKVAVCTVVPVIEPVLLPAVQFHVRGIDVQHQPLRYPAPLAPHQVQLHEQLVESTEIRGDLARLRPTPPVR